VDPTNSGSLAQRIAPARQLDNRSPADQITNAVNAVIAAVKTAPQFSGLKDPPQAGGHAAAPPPASAPTTGPVVVPGAIAVPPGGVAPPQGAGATTTRPHPGTGTSTPKQPGAAGTPP